MKMKEGDLVAHNDLATDVIYTLHLTFVLATREEALQTLSLIDRKVVLSEVKKQ